MDTLEWPYCGPYIIYGTIERNNKAQSGILVKMENINTGKHDTRTTDDGGHYLFDDLAELGHEHQVGNHQIRISTLDTTKTFNAKAKPEEKEINFKLR